MYITQHYNATWSTVIVSWRLERTLLINRQLFFIIIIIARTTLRAAISARENSYYYYYSLPPVLRARTVTRMHAHTYTKYTQTLPSTKRPATSVYI